MSRQGRRDGERTADILDAISKVERWRAVHDRDDDMFRSAVMRELGTIGEAVNGLSDGFKAMRPEIPWRSIVDLRNVLTHHYWDTAWALIEQILDDDLRELRRSIASSGILVASASGPDRAMPPSLNSKGSCGRWMPRARTHCILSADHNWRLPIEVEPPSDLWQRWPPAGTPEVPLGARLGSATGVVLARRSAPSRARSARLDTARSTDDGPPNRWGRV